MPRGSPLRRQATLAPRVPGIDGASPSGRPAACPHQLGDPVARGGMGAGSLPVSALRGLPPNILIPWLGTAMPKISAGACAAVWLVHSVAGALTRWLRVSRSGGEGTTREGGTFGCNRRERAQTAGQAGLSRTPDRLSLPSAALARQFLVVCWGLVPTAHFLLVGRVVHRLEDFFTFFGGVFLPWGGEMMICP